MSFTRYMAVLKVIAGAEVGVTAGQINKRLPKLSVAQIKLTLRDLVGEGAVIEQKYQYRPHIEARVYTLHKQVVQTCEQIIWRYEEAKKQKGFQELLNGGEQRIFVEDK